MNWFTKKILPYLSIILTAMILLHTFISVGVPNTHDGHNQLARASNFYLAIKDGQIPPRWAPNLNYQFGYPVFNYNYYLGYIPMVVFYALGTSWEVAIKLVTLLAMISAGIFLYQFLREYLSIYSSLIGSVLFMASPQYLSQIFVRGNLGEITSWAVFILIILSIQQTVLQKKLLIKKYSLHIWPFILAISVAMLAIAHNTVFVLGLPITILFAIIMIYTKYISNQNLSSKPIQYSNFQVFLFILLGLGLGAYFILPAFTELNFITLPYVGISRQFLGHFVYLQQFFYSPWGYKYSEIGINDGMSFMLGFVHWGLIFMGILLFIKLNFNKLKWRKIIQNSHNVIILLFSSLLILSLFAMTSASKFIWQILYFLQKIQFPWRLMFVATISISILGAFSFEYIYKKLNQIKKHNFDKFRNLLFVSIFILTIGFGLSWAKAGNILHQDDWMYMAFPFTSSTEHENLPQGFEMAKNSEYKTKLADINNVATFKQLIWKSNLHRYQVNTDKDTTIIEHLAMFPGWQTFIDGKQIKIISDNPNYQGVITYKISSGKHLVETRFTENTLARKLGDTITIISSLLLVIIIIKSIQKENKS